VSLFYLPGVSDQAIATQMSVFDNPINTLPRYQPGVHGVAVSLGRLEDAIYDLDRMAVCSILGDMAACVGLNADVPPRGPMNLAAVCWNLKDLEDALETVDLDGVTAVVKDMANLMSLRIHPRYAREDRP
jgi:hypothetical protein